MITTEYEREANRLSDKAEINSYTDGVRTTTFWPTQKTGRVESLQQQIDEWVKRCEFLLDENEELDQERKALLSRCRVAEDLNKVYVRMYLEMQEKHDRLAKYLCDSDENLN